MASLGLVAAGCSADTGGEPESTTAAPTATSSTAGPSIPRPEPSPIPTPKPAKPVRGLKGNTSNAIAYAPLSNPDDITVEGSVPSSRAWSTSKVLVVLAFIDTVADGNPDNLSAHWKARIKSALTASDMNALLQIRAAIPGGSGTPMTGILRSIGDTETSAPDSSEGSMQWSIRNQIRFMAALYNGEVVSKKASRYVLGEMHPIKAHSWGLGTIGASAFKGGWLEPYTETRQMGILGDYAVAIITAGVGPAELQTDGDWAHVRQMNKLAKILKAQVDAASVRSTVEQNAPRSR
ncbi:MAG: hypothetical protein U0990_01295 [Candidatus Nanopelagicales bacterium]|nr:hypothetical protein [Candidatus Nanopelagicales bacterium]